MEQRQWRAAVGKLCRQLFVSDPQEVLLVLQVVTAVVPLGRQVGRVLLQCHPGVEWVGGNGGHGIHGSRRGQAVIEIRGWGARGRRLLVFVGFQPCGHSHCHGPVVVPLQRLVAYALLDALPAKVVEFQHGQQKRHAGHHQHEDDKDVLLCGSGHVAVHGIGTRPGRAEVHRLEEYPIYEILHHYEGNLHHCSDQDAQDVSVEQGSF